VATKEEKEKLIEVLKFTPRTYKVRLWGYGGEHVMGSFDRKIYDYFKRRRLDISEFAWDYDYAEENNIPEDMFPFEPGNWHDCDDMGHCWGVDRSAGTIQVEDENGDIVYEQELDSITGMGLDGEPPEPEWGGGDEYWIDSAAPGTPVFIAVSSEKGTFFEAELPLTTPFNAGKFSLTYDDIDGNEIITGVTYDGVDLDNFGGDTSGKGSDFGFYIAGSNKQDGKGYEKYRTMDDIDYTLTEWFPKKIKPFREGLYNVKTAGKNSYTYQANWNGTDWHNTWGSGEPLKIKEWQGIAYDPDEQDLRDELDKIALEVPGFPTAAEIDALEQVECVECEWRGVVGETVNKDGEMICPECGEHVDFFEPVNMAPWTNKKTKPEVNGHYEVCIDAPWPNSGPSEADWDGKTWTKDGEKVKITQWRNLKE